MSQSSVAKAMGTSQSAIARIESAQENITLDTLRRLVVVLRGRFDVSIPPEECAATRLYTWWQGAASQWSVVGVVGRQLHQTEQVIVGLERPNGSVLTATTLPLRRGMLLEASSTEAKA